MMKKIVAVLVVCMTVFSFAGCGNKDNDNASSDMKEEKYIFSYNNVDVKMDVEADDVISKLGSDYTYFEAASCAFEGLDKMYKYGEAFEVGTYPKDDKDYISYVYLYNDTVSTKEGVKVGDSVDDMKKAYGDGTENLGSYEYAGDDMTLKFIIEDNVISEIDYCSNASKEADTK